MILKYYICKSASSQFRALERLHFDISTYTYFAKRLKCQDSKRRLAPVFVVDAGGAVSGRHLYVKKPNHQQSTCFIVISMLKRLFASSSRYGHPSSHLSHLTYCLIYRSRDQNRNTEGQNQPSTPSSFFSTIKPIPYYHSRISRRELSV
jgi:hypothetical protein